jgi:hypothetical protein
MPGEIAAHTMPRSWDGRPHEPTGAGLLLRVMTPDGQQAGAPGNGSLRDVIT